MNVIFSDVDSVVSLQVPSTVNERPLDEMVSISASTPLYLNLPLVLSQSGIFPLPNVTSVFVEPPTTFSAGA